uniref:uro-adherence factor A n=1 Tax=Semicossyphus pulcher TaxID=241346 RepID=UPI0037E7F713
MNLYRSFGNLMEAWVTEGGRSMDSEWLGLNDEDSPTPSSNLRSESVDSGVETASSETSFPATSCSVSTDYAEIDASISQSPVLSSPLLLSSASSSPHLSPSGPRESSIALHQKLEQALQRTDSKCLQENSGTPTVDEVLRRRPKRHTSEVVRGQRSSVPARQMSEMCRRPMSMICGTQTRPKVLHEEEGSALSPGLCYLEQVCQMLEEIARQQMHSRALQKEMDALREHQDMEAVDTCRGDFKAAEEELDFCRRLENTKSFEARPQQRRHFRQRSASDTSIAMLHLSKMATDCRGQHLSTDGEQEEEEVHKKQESRKEDANVTHKNWRLKLASLRREESAVGDPTGQQMQPSERNSARRRLSQLFRRGRRTLPA